LVDQTSNNVMKNALFPISPRTPPSVNYFSRSPPPLSPFSRNNPSIFQLNIPTKKVQSTKPAEKERIITDLLSCGANNVGQLGHQHEEDTCKPSHVISTTKHVRNVTCGANHNLALSSSGHLFVWGCNDHGQLGLPEYDYCLNQATLVQYNIRHENIVRFGAGGNFSLAISQRGTVFTWGCNDDGQLGHGDQESRDVPEKVEELVGVAITDVYGGFDFSVFRTNNGEVYTCGGNDFGQLGHSDFALRDIPEQIPNLKGVKKIAVGGFHCIALLDSDKLLSWGCNDRFQLGNGTNQNSNYPTIMKKIPHKISNIHAGYKHTIIEAEYGFIYVCGANERGQLGLGDLQDRSIPTRISTHRFVKVFPSSNSNHWFSVSLNGELLCVGSNTRGQLMTGDTQDCKTPTKVNNHVGYVVDMGLGAEHTVIITTKEEPFIRHMRSFRDLVIICTLVD
jgi:alpha-tubulin suppressor-like RCC1 family protein